MNDHLPNGTLDDLTLDSAPLDLGSFDGFDPFAGEEEAIETPAAETSENNVTPLPRKFPAHWTETVHMGRREVA
jgi:hypothetical protein